MWHVALGIFVEPPGNGNEGNKGDTLVCVWPMFSFAWGASGHLLARS
jgi:hypothetical protein